MSRPDWLPSTSVSIDMHVHETATLDPHVYPDAQRATVTIDGTGGRATLYGERDSLARLRDLLVDAVAQLDAARQHPAA